MASTTFGIKTTDQVKAYWDARPCNIRHSTAKIGTRQYFDEVEARKYYVEPHILEFAQFDKWAGKRVLEIGCGIGTAAIGFARAGAIVTAVDLSDESLKLARVRADVYGLSDKITFYQANAEELQSTVPVEPYDLIYSFGVIHHTPHPTRAIEQLKEYTKPGSTVKIMLYNRLSWKVLWIILTEGKGQFWRADELIACHSEAQSGCPVTYTYTSGEIRDMLLRVGLTDINAVVDHIFPYRIREYVQYKYVREWFFNMIPLRAFRWLERRLGWHLCVTATVPSNDAESASSL